MVRERSLDRGIFESVQIVNVVATTNLETDIDLHVLSQILPNDVIYDPEIYPQPTPAYFKTPDLKGQVSIFSSGKLISMGSKSKKEAKEDLKIAVDSLKKSYLIETIKFEVQIQNIVTLLILGRQINLSIIAEQLKDSYMVNKFPGLIYKSRSPKTTFLIFSTGKIIVTGAKKIKDIEKSIVKIGNILGKIK